MESINGYVETEGNRIPKSSTERSRQSRTRRKLLKRLHREVNGLTKPVKIAKTGAERMRDLRKRRKENESKASASGYCFQCAQKQHFPVKPVEFFEMEGIEKRSVCRLCLSEDAEVMYVFEARRFEGWTAADGIAELLQMQVLEDDEYPHSVCVDCMGKLEDFKVFKGICERNKQLLDRAYAEKRGDTGRKEAAEEVSNVERNLINGDYDDISATLEKDPLELSEDDVKLRSIDSPLVSVKSNDVINSEHVPFITVKTKELYDEGETVNNDIQSDVLGESASEEFIPAVGRRFAVISDVVRHLKEEVEDISVDCINDELLEEEKSISSEYVDSRFPADDLASVRVKKLVHLSDTIPGAESTTSTTNDCTGVVQRKKGNYDAIGCRSPVPQRGRIAGGDGISEASNEESTAKVGGSKLEPISSNTDLKKYRCNVCSKRFVILEDVVEHMEEHVSSEAFFCEHCSTVFELKDSYKKHSCMKNRVGKRFSCDWCGKEYSCLTDLERHLTVHTGDKPFKCNLCSKLFTRLHSLNRHLAIHERENPFKCHVCRSVFSQKNDLQSHLEIHSEKNPYQCMECCKVYTQMSTLRQHLRNHCRKEEYSRRDGDKTISNPSNKHATVNSQVLKCSHCKRCFKRKASLAKHLTVDCVRRSTKC